MPVFNTEAYLQAAIQSVIEQTFTDFELLLINDGSTDGSLAIIDGWVAKDQRLHVFSQPNQGLSAARNTGMVHATGSYIYFMDSDDRILPDTLACCYSDCEERQLDFVFFDAEVFADGISNAEVIKNFNYKRTKFSPSVVYSGTAAFNQLLSYQEYFSSACLIFINKSFLENIGLIFAKGILHEDELFTALLFLQARRTAYVQAPFFQRRIREDSIMTMRYAMKNIKSYFFVANNLLVYANDRADVRPLVDKYLQGMLNAAVWKAHVMPLQNRLAIGLRSFWNYRKYIRWKTWLALLFKKYKRKV